MSGREVLIVNEGGATSPSLATTLPHTGLLPVYRQHTAVEYPKGKKSTTTD